MGYLFGPFPLVQAGGTYADYAILRVVDDAVEKLKRTAALPVSSPINRQIMTPVPGKYARYYEVTGKEILPDTKTAVSRYILCVNQALKHPDDDTCRAIFISEMEKQAETTPWVQETNREILLSLSGEELKTFIAGLALTGISKVEVAFNGDGNFRLLHSQPDIPDTNDDKKDKPTARK
jgi:hypothetical protein